MADKKTLLVVDGHSAAFRAFYALDPANFRTQEGNTLTRCSDSCGC